MAHPIISEEECIGCGIGVDACPQEVLEVIDYAQEAPTSWEIISPEIDGKTDLMSCKYLSV